MLDVVIKYGTVIFALALCGFYATAASDRADVQTSNKELCSKVPSLSKRLLAFENYYLTEYEKIEAASTEAIKSAKTEDERKKVGQRENVRSMFQYEQLQEEFSATLLPEVLDVWEELMTRLGRRRVVPDILQFVFVGSLPPRWKLLKEMATHLEKLSRDLCIKASSEAIK